MPTQKPLDIKKLRSVYDCNKLGFETTADLKPVASEVMGQERALESLSFGLGMEGYDYNVYVAGPKESGRGYLTQSLVKRQAAKEPSPPDWVYVHNFKNPDAPRAIMLRQGRAKEFAKDLTELIEDVKAEIPDIFESDDYSTRRDKLVAVFNQKRTALLQELEEKVKAEGFLINMSQVGMVIMPAKDEKPLEEADIAAMSDQDKEALKEKSTQLQGEMNQTVREIRKIEKGLKAQLKDLDKRIALFAVGHLIDELQEKYSDQKEVLHHLKDVKDDIILNIDDFKQRSGQQQMSPFPMPQPEADLSRYQVNVLVDNSECKGAPVVVETNPSYSNLFGSMERRAQFGALFTDFTMIRPGALHRANGGYLVINTIDLLKFWISYEALKRAMKNEEIKLEEPGEMYGIITTKGMKPEPIPMRVKVILVGDPMYYHLLYSHDEGFAKLFKVKAQLSENTDKKPKQVKEFVQFVRRVVEEQGLLPMDKTGVARLIDRATKVGGSQDKITLQLAEIADLIREAAYWAKQKKSKFISAEHVHQAIRSQIYRNNLYEERIQEVIQKDIIHVPVKGEEVGQINGLSVYMLGDYAFGRPSRITANVSLGKSGTVSIDRESKMSGSIHTKGVLILEGYLRGMYAQEAPLSLTASLAFEQSYGMVDGDSASGAELYAIISALSGLPLKQGIACTGAISQRGELQAIGGVNYKVEGHYEVCKAAGFTGEQGCIIPKSNVKDLMLKPEVIEAVEAGNFNVWAVDHVDRALEILTGKSAGQKRKDGTYTPDSIHAVVTERLKDMAEKIKQAGGNGNGKKSADNDAPSCDACGK